MAARFVKRTATESREQAPGVVDRVQRAWGESLFYQAGLRGPAPDRIGFQPADPFASDKALAEAIVQGRIEGGLQSIDCAGELERIWALAPREGEAHAFLHQFVWLRHLPALGERGAAAARVLADGWLAAHEKWSPESWEPYTTGERLINLCRRGQFILARSDALWRSRMLTSMARQTRHLARVGHRAQNSADRLMTALALCISGLCLPGCEEPAERGVELLRRELRLQLRPDGGHISRNPAIQLEIVIRLQNALAAIEARRMPAPSFLKHAAERAAAHLRLFRVGDGGLAVFNGGGESDGAAVAVAIAGVETESEPSGFARYSGYQRLESGRSALIVDIGATRPPLAGGPAHHGAGAFHFSSGRSRIVVNCGSGRRLSSEWAAALRQPAAHSTLSAEPPGALAALSKAAMFAQQRLEDDMGQLLEIERVLGDADGPSRHLRRFFLSRSGDDLRGEDRLTAPPAGLASSWRLRFHLHPSVKASMARDGKSVIIALSNREGWRFRCNAPGLSIERSVYCGQGGANLGGGPASCEQIVMHPTGLEPALPQDIVLRWSFKRLEGG